MLDDCIELSFGDVRQKIINTPNHFISHMIEHIAWRMGLEICVQWRGADWRSLGRRIGIEIGKLSPRIDRAAALGMIDDGSAVVSIELEGGGVKLSAVSGVDSRWFLGLRCEQIESGQSLLEFLEGVGAGLGAGIFVEIWSFEDPHHTWEAIFRGVGIVLGKIYSPQSFASENELAFLNDSKIETAERGSELTVIKRGVHFVEIQRGTAESGIVMALDFLSTKPNAFTFEVDESIRESVLEAEKIITLLTERFGITMQIEFKAKQLSSRHVVMEDIGLVMGRAFLEVLKLRMERYGVNGAGSNICNLKDVNEKKVHIGISVEGRKFLRLVSEDGDINAMRREFLIGQNIFSGLRSEDLDDFLDGLAGGMSASIIIHLRNYSNVEDRWKELFVGLGDALKEVFAANPFRRRVPPGVKATLA